MIRLVAALILSPALALAAEPPIDYPGAGPKERALLSRAVQELYRTCPRLGTGRTGIGDIKVWVQDAEIDVAAAKFWPKWFVFIKVRFFDNSQIVDSDVANKWFTKDVTFWLGGSPHPGVYPANPGAHYVCGQRLPWNDDAVIPSPRLTFLNGLSAAADADDPN